MTISKIEIGIVGMFIFLINLYYNPHMITEWRETLPALLFIAYPLYILVYMLIRFSAIGVIQYAKDKEN